MSWAGNYTPAQSADDKSWGMGFFGELLAGQTVQSAVVTLKVLAGIDPAASSHVIGAASVSADGFTVSQRLNGLVSGVTYAVNFKANLTNPTEVTNLWGTLPCIDP
jgi:hypothetical protein